MKNIKFYQVDAFTDQLFKGNPAGVCPLDEWISVELMQSIALENNLSETAFYVNSNNNFEIRWFTPTTEVDLCGHATLASAFVEFNVNNNKAQQIVFKSKSGDLIVSNNEELLTLDFPIDNYSRIDLTPELLIPFKEKPIEAYKAGPDILLIFENETIIKEMNPSLEKIKQIKARGITVSSKGESYDFVSRFFGPQSGINEDPVTGSIHTYLSPFWGEKLKKNSLKAIQLSKRGGILNCKLNGDRVEISGNAKLYLKGEIFISN